LAVKAKRGRPKIKNMAEAAVKEEILGGPPITEAGGNGHFPSEATEAEEVAEVAGGAVGKAIDFQEIARILEGVDNLDSPIDASDHDIEPKLGVMQRLITAVMKDNDYLQTLLMASFKDERQAGYCADAISEALRYGCNIRPIMNRIYAQCGIRAERALQVLSAINSYTINTRNNNNLPKWKKDQNRKQIA